MNVTHREIVEYWAARESDAGLGVNWSEAETRCWRCGYEGRLERCHIVPSALGGADEPHNLVLLCKRCHREAPNVADPRYMWIWLRKTPPVTSPWPPQTTGMSADTAARVSSRSHGSSMASGRPRSE